MDHAVSGEGGVFHLDTLPLCRLPEYVAPNDDGMQDAGERHWPLRSIVRIFRAERLLGSLRQQLPQLTFGMLADLRIELLRRTIAHVVDPADNLAPRTGIDAEADAQIELREEGHASEVDHVGQLERFSERLHD